MKIKKERFYDCELHGKLCTEWECRDCDENENGADEKIEIPDKCTNCGGKHIMYRFWAPGYNEGIWMKKLIC